MGRQPKINSERKNNRLVNDTRRQCMDKGRVKASYWLWATNVILLHVFHISKKPDQNHQVFLPHPVYCGVGIFISFDIAFFKQLFYVIHVHQFFPSFLSLQYMYVIWCFNPWIHTYLSISFNVDWTHPKVKGPWARPIKLFFICSSNLLRSGFCDDANYGFIYPCFSRGGIHNCGIENLFSVSDMQFHGTKWHLNRVLNCGHDSANIRSGRMTMASV